MVELYGKRHTRRDLARRAGSLSQFAGVQLSILGDGVERGIRCLEFRTGTGLRLQGLVDRAFDIADCEYRGAAIGWHSPTGFRHPALHDYDDEGGLSWLRSFSGLLLHLRARSHSVHEQKPGRALSLCSSQDGR